MYIYIYTYINIRIYIYIYIHYWLFPIDKNVGLFAARLEATGCRRGSGVLRLHDC